MMIRKLIALFAHWLRQASVRRHARKRLADLQRQLIIHDQDMSTMTHFPQTVQDRMAAYRERLVQQIEAVSKHV